MVKNNVAWIIGAAGGIGQMCAETLSKNYQRLCLFDKRDASYVFESHDFFQVDFSNYEVALEQCLHAVQEYGAPEILCFAAGEVISQPFDKTTENIVYSLFQNNFLALINSLKIFYDCCDKSSFIRKNIIIISSNAGVVARVNQPIYAALKAAINSLIRSLAKDWGKFNIKVNGIAPGTVIVNRNIDSLKVKFPDFPIDKSRPLPQLMYPNNMAPVIQFLMNKDVPITGQIIVIDGGSTL